VLKSNIYLKQ